MDINSPLVDQQVEKLLATIEAEGKPILDRENKKNWIKDKLQKGFSLQVIYQSLKTNNFDFVTTGAYLDNMAKGRQEAQQAIKEVKEIKEEKAKKEKSEKKAAHVTYIIIAYVLSGVGFFVAFVIKNALGETAELITGSPIGSFMNTFIKAGWIVGITGAAVGTLLVVMLLADYFKRKAKKQEAEDRAGVKKEKEAKTTAEKMQQIEQRLAQQPAQPQAPPQQPQQPPQQQ